MSTCTCMYKLAEWESHRRWCFRSCTGSSPGGSAGGECVQNSIMEVTSAVCSQPASPLEASTTSSSSSSSSSSSMAHKRSDRYSLPLCHDYCALQFLINIYLVRLADMSRLSCVDWCSSPLMLLCFWWLAAFKVFNISMFITPQILHRSILYAL